MYPQIIFFFPADNRIEGKKCQSKHTSILVGVVTTVLESPLLIATAQAGEREREYETTSRFGREEEI